MIVQYKPKRNLIQTILMVELLRGLGLTLKRMFSRPITRQYPEEKPDIQIGFRGKHALVRDRRTGTTKCVACMRCATVCPSRCIHIHYHEDPASGARQVRSYEIEALRCIYCGYCEEVCPVNALVLAEDFEYCGRERKEFHFDMERLLDHWDEFMASGKYREDRYVNPFWRPRGLPEALLTSAKRLDVPQDWTIAGQFVGRHHQARDIHSIREGR